MYTAQVLALWNAHCNIVVVSDSNWKGYLAKYATKADPRGQLALDEEAARQLGLTEYSQEQVRLTLAWGITLSSPTSSIAPVLLLSPH